MNDKPAVTADDGLLTRAIEMRNAIDALENALMGYGDLVEMPRVWETASDEQIIHPRVTVEQMRRVCTALSECTRIINSDDYTAQSLSALERTTTPWKPIDYSSLDFARDSETLIIGWYSLDGSWQWVRAHWTGDEWDAGSWVIDHCKPTHWLQPRDLPLPPPPPQIADIRGTEP